MNTPPTDNGLALPEEPMDEAQSCYANLVIYSFECQGPFVWHEPGTPGFPKSAVAPYPLPKPPPPQSNG